MTTSNNNGPAVAAKNTDVATQQPSPSERFTNAVMREFSSNNGEIELTAFQRKLCQNYFIKIDMMLKEAERKRLAKSEQYRDAVPLTWENVNLQKLATDVIIFSSVGLDPTQPNHISPIPFKNNGTGKYDIAFIMGYRGVELKAKKYGFDIPDDVVVELVYANDKFEALKKDANNKVENYKFEIAKSFDRGDLVGGFYYMNYFEKPEKNKLRIFSKKDIDKRKPDSASAEFWGGQRPVWKNGQKTGTEEVEGWYDEMAFKTIYRAAYNAITIDSEKIDGNYLSFIVKEGESRDLKLQQEIDENSNKSDVGFTAAEIVTPGAETKEATTPAEDSIPAPEVNLQQDKVPAAQQQQQTVKQGELLKDF